MSNGAVKCVRWKNVKTNAVSFGAYSLKKYWHIELLTENNIFIYTHQMLMNLNKWELKGRDWEVADNHIAWESTAVWF